MKKNRLFRLQAGQALVTLLFFMIIGITVITATAVILYTNISAVGSQEQGIYAYNIAESGAEEGLLRLIRNPGFGGETISVGSGTATILVTDGIITVTGKYNTAVRKIQVQTAYDLQNGLQVLSWKEIN